MHQRILDRFRLSPDDPQPLGRPDDPVAGAVGTRTVGDRGTNGRALRLGVFALAVGLAIAGGGEFWLHIRGDPLTDFRVYYDAAARLNAGLPLYPPGARIYPPLFEIVLRPLALLPFDLAAAVWVGMTGVAFLLTLWRIGLARPATWLAVGMLGIGIGWTLAIGQAEILVTLLLTLGSPMTVALAANIKIFPILAGTYWLARRDWRNLGRLIAWTTAFILLQLALDPANTLAFPATLTVVGSQISTPGAAILSPFSVSPALWAALLILGIAATLRLGRTRWGWAAAVALSVLASPHLLAYMLTSLLACLRQPDHEESRSPSKRRQGSTVAGGSSSVER